MNDADLMGVIERLGCLSDQLRHAPHVSRRVPTQLAERNAATASYFRRDCSRMRQSCSYRPGGRFRVPCRRCWCHRAERLAPAMNCIV